MSPTHPLLTRRRLLSLAGAGAVGLTAACTSKKSTTPSTTGTTGVAGSAAKVAITLEGPNQWNSDSATFGKPWEQLIAAFEKAEPNITVKTTVLPLTTFGAVEATQLSAGTAPELVFNQAAHKPYMVTPLDSYLKKPNPYIAGSKQWVDGFRSKFYGFGNAASINGSGNIEFVPFNLVGIGLFYNKTIFKKAGVTAPFATFGDLLAGAMKLRAAGYTPLAMDASDLGPSWTASTISNMLTAKYYNAWNTYDATGKPGKSNSGQLTLKAVTAAIMKGQYSAQGTPEVGEALRLMKLLWDTCCNKDWNGTAGDTGSIVDLQDFSSGKAAMAWGVNFGVSALAGVDFEYSSMPFPTISKADSPLSTGAPAQFGASTGGTSYMIPSTVKGDKLAAAVKFLQYVSTPQKIQPWLTGTGGISAVDGATGAAATQAFANGTWGQALKMGQTPNPPAGTTVLSMFDGYLIGAKSLADEKPYLENLWLGGAKQNITDNSWGSESWASAKG